jgi:hypothetical protein
MKTLLSMVVMSGLLWTAAGCGPKAQTTPAATTPAATTPAATTVPAGAPPP